VLAPVSAGRRHRPVDPNPEYVFSLYRVTSGPWTAGPEFLLATGFDHPDIISFGVRGVSTGYAGWSGVAYAAHSHERSLTIDELVACELTVQALWCFSRQIQQLVEDGQDPSTQEDFGWRFLRAASSRLTAARAQETAQHVLMREAIMKTSGLAERLRSAQDALRDSVG
jgi:hypothetical protein